MSVSARSGGQVDSKDAQGQTPLMRAVKMGYEDNVMAILAKRAEAGHQLPLDQPERPFLDICLVGADLSQKEGPSAPLVVLFSFGQTCGRRMALALEPTLLETPCTVQYCNVLCSPWKGAFCPLDSPIGPSHCAGQHDERQRHGTGLGQWLSAPLF